MHNKTIIDNLRIVSDQIDNINTVAVSIWVNSGSRHETKALNGISHFLEHMAFKGTKTQTASEIAQEFDNIGGSLNAYTSRDKTVYYAKVLKKDFNLCIDILSDIILNSQFCEEEIEKERGVILQELAMTIDTADDIIFDYHQEESFKDQALGRSILGTKENINRFSRDDLISYVNNNYNRNSIIISVAGNIKHEDAVNYIAPRFASLKQGEIPFFEKAKFTHGEFIKEKDLEQVHIVLGFEGESYFYKNNYGIKLLANIIGGGMSSRLFQEVREKKGLAYNIGCFNSSYNDTGVFSIYAGTNNRHANEMLDTICGELKSLTNNINSEELERAKNQALSSLLMGLENSSFRAEKLGGHYSIYNDYFSEEKIKDLIDDVKINDIKELLQSLITRNYSLAALGNISNIDFNIENRLK